MRAAGLIATALFAGMSGTEARAEEHDGAAFALEMPAHRALMSGIAEKPIAPFSTDGCSGGLSTSWRIVADLFPDFADVHEGVPPWEDCCVTHDMAYHDAGGAMDADASFKARLSADEGLRQCVVDQGRLRRLSLAAQYDVEPALIDRAYTTIGDAMFTAVRFGGAPCSGLPWRWGYGYPGCFPGLP